VSPRILVVYCAWILPVLTGWLAPTAAALALSLISAVRLAWRRGWFGSLFVALVAGWIVFRRFDLLAGSLLGVLTMAFALGGRRTAWV
jgi:hypothetical protein